MEQVARPLSKKEILALQKQYGDYLKLTADLEKEVLVVGGELHTDAEKLLLEQGSGQGEIWGGGIDLKERLIDTTAVLNLRPRLGNDSLEILDRQRREKFLRLVRKIFRLRWKG